MLLNKYEYFHIQDFSPGSLELKMRSWVNLLKWAVIIRVTWMISGCFFQVTEIRLWFNKDHCQLLVFESKRTFDKWNFFNLNQSQRVQNLTIQNGPYFLFLSETDNKLLFVVHFRFRYQSLPITRCWLYPDSPALFKHFWLFLNFKIRTLYQCNFDQWKISTDFKSFGTLV